MQVPDFLVELNENEYVVNLNSPIFMKRFGQASTRGSVRLLDITPRILQKSWIESGSLCDARVVSSARVSYESLDEDKRTALKKSSDKDLLRYLYRHHHETPFEMIDLTWIVEAPLFVARQWFRHRMASYNEVSARYTEVNDEQFFDMQNLRVQSKSSKQSSYGFANEDLQTRFEQFMNTEDKYTQYKALIDEGCAREQLRAGLPQNMMTRFMCKMNLRSFINFYTLRTHETAQEEIRNYANAMGDMIRYICPLTMKAVDNYTINSIILTEDEIIALKNKDINLITNKSEQKEFLTKIEKLGLTF